MVSVDTMRGISEQKYPFLGVSISIVVNILHVGFLSQQSRAFSLIRLLIPDVMVLPLLSFARACFHFPHTVLRSSFSVFVLPLQVSNNPVVMLLTTFGGELILGFFRGVFNQTPINLSLIVYSWIL